MIWVPIDSVFRMEGHSLRGSGRAYVPRAGEAIPDEHKEVSAVMIRFRKPELGMMMSMTVNRQGQAATLAWPIGQVVSELFEKVGWVSRVLELTAYLVMGVASASILASVHNTMNERRREFAILRALGARRRTLLAAVVIEAASIAALGALAGLAVYAAILSLAAAIVREQTGVVLSPWEYAHALWAVPIAMIGLGSLAGLLPALRAYATDVAAHLGPLS